MERKYFPINESNARASHNMMSMREYVEGSTTAHYRNMIDKAYEVADKVAEKKPEEAERAYRLAERYSKKMAEYYNKWEVCAQQCRRKAERNGGLICRHMDLNLTTGLRRYGQVDGEPSLGSAGALMKYLCCMTEPSGPSLKTLRI